MVEDNVRALAVENELKKFGVFSDKYALKLDGICNLNQDEKIGPSNGEWCRWDCDQNILLAKVDNHEYGNNIGALCGIGNENGGIVVDNRTLSKGDSTTA